MGVSPCRLVSFYGCWFPSSTCRSVFMHEPGNAVLFLQYLYVLYLGIHGLVEVFLSRRCSLPWLANLMLYSAFFPPPRDVCVSVHRFSKNIDTTSKS